MSIMRELIKKVDAAWDDVYGNFGWNKETVKAVAYAMIEGAADAAILCFIPYVVSDLVIRKITKK